MTKKKIIKTGSTILVFAAFTMLFLFACKKNDINVIDADVNGSTSAGSTTSTTSTSTTSSSTTSTSGTTTGSCNPTLNSATFSNNFLNGFSSMTGSPVTWNGYYTLYVSVTVSGYLRTIRLSLPMSSAPTSSATYALDYNYFTNGYVLGSGKCGLRFYEATSGNTYYGYGSSGTVTVTVTGSYVVAKFCSVTFKAYNGSTFVANYTATGKIDN